jgi:hypothetical protein
MRTFNTEYAPKLGVPKIQMNALYDIVTYLQESGIIKVGASGKMTDNGAKGLMLTKKRVSGINAPGKVFTVELNVDIEELNLAMKKSQIYEALKDPEEEKNESSDFLQIPCCALGSDKPQPLMKFATSKKNKVFLIFNSASR